VATRRSKPTLKDRPKYRQDRALKNRRQTAKKAGARRRTLGRVKAGRKRRGGIKRR
jgi:hypothetical protein